MTSAASAAPACAGADLQPTAANQAAVDAATLCLLNGVRADHGLAALTADPLLAAAAEAYSATMVAQRFFDHVTPGGVDLISRLEQVGYVTLGGDWTVGENIGWGQGPLSTPAAMVGAWMTSPGHRENILEPAYREIGIGVAPGSPDAAYVDGATYTTDFGVIAGAGGSRAATAGAPAAAAATRPRRKHRRHRRRAHRRARAHA